jgi:hypothetical protein
VSQKKVVKNCSLELLQLIEREQVHFLNILFLSNCKSNSELHQGCQTQYYSCPLRFGCLVTWFSDPAVNDCEVEELYRALPKIYILASRRM